MAKFTAAPPNESGYVLEGTQTVHEGEVLRYTVEFPGWSTIAIGDSTATNVYVGGSTDTSNWVPGSSTGAGSTSVSGNLVVLPSLTVPAGLGGSTAVVEVGARSSNGFELRKTGIVHIILKPGQE